MDFDGKPCPHIVLRITEPGAYSVNEGQRVDEADRRLDDLAEGRFLD